jgi:hemerythrin-like domain-containing protein
VQRHPALRNLSSEHHSGLARARRARQAASGDRHAQSDAWVTVVDRFQTELEPHFRLEEAGLLPAMQRAGEATLVERALREHAVLRSLVAEGRVENLRPFAELLAAHIRFEEKELFERAQGLFDLGTLEDLANA